MSENYGCIAKRAYDKIKTYPVIDSIFFVALFTPGNRSHLCIHLHGGQRSDGGADSSGH